MASVIRVKRRIDDDPAEALILSCKRQRHADVTDKADLASVLSFAGTITSKDEPVSRHIKDAIRKKKLHKELHSQTADFKHSLHIPELTKKLRKETEQASRANRYRVTWSRRALDLDCLDKDDETCDDSNIEKDSILTENGGQEEKSNDKCKLSEDIGLSKTEDHLENKENDISNLLQTHSDGGDSRKIQTSNSVPSSDSSTTERTLPQHCPLTETKFKSDGGGASNSKSFIKEDKMFCIFDVESEQEEDPLQGMSQQSTSGITMNNVPMVSKRVVTPPPNESQFVYDLYYTHNNLSDLDLQAVLTVEALCDDFVNDEPEDSPDRDLVYDDSDDSNEESNWRNDYPDEDPRFFENEEEEYNYAEDMVDTNFLTDDDGDLLAYWMNTRCRVDEDSDNDEDEYDKDKSSDEDESDES